MLPAGQLGWAAGVAIGLGFLLLSSLVGLVVVVRMPADFFVRPALTVRARGFSQLTWIVLKNVVGLVVFLMGVLMALPLVPGPGILFMLVGMAMADFPGKRAIERRLLHAPRVLSSVNRMRARFGKPPLVTDKGVLIRSA